MLKNGGIRDMNKNKKMFKHKDVFEWIIPYVVVLIIPIITCAVFFWHSFTITWEETQNLNEAALQLVRDDLDAIFEKSYTMEYSVSNNYVITSLQYLDKNMQASDNYSILEASDALSKYRVWDEAIYSCSIFFPKLELLMGQGYKTISNSYDQAAAEYGLTTDEFKQLIFGKHSERKFFINAVNGNLCYVSSYPFSGKQLKYNIIIEFSKDYFQKVFSAMSSFDDNAIMVVDKNGTVLVGNNDANIDFKSIEFSNENVIEYYPYNLDGNRMLVCCLQSRMVGVNYVSVIPYEIFWKRATDSLIVFIAALLACAVLGLVVSWFFAKRRQKTYGILNNFIKEHFGIEEQGVLIKRKKIASAITNLLDEYNTIQNSLESANETKRELIVSSIFEGKIKSENIEQVIQKNAVDLAVGNYILILVRNSKYGNIYESYQKQVTTTDMEKMAEAVSYLVSNAEKKGLDCEVLHVSEGIVCIYNFGDILPEENEILLSDCKERLESLKEHVAIAVSAMHNQVYSFNSAYSEVMSVMEYLMTNSAREKAVMEYSEMVTDRQMQFLFTIEDEVEFVGFLKNGKEEEAKQKVLELCEKNILNSKGNRDVFKCMILNLASCILQTENTLNCKNELPDVYLWLNNICNDDSSNSSVDLLNGRIHDICEAIYLQKDNKESDLIERIQEYIKNNYQDENLDNSAVAEHFGISLGYLSTVFKRNTGEKLIDYIQQLRFEEAKNLLLNSQLGVEEISTAVGCTAKTLRRLFKKNIGISPTQFREENKKN